MYKQPAVYLGAKETSNYTKIITSPYENKIKALAISDIHFGSQLERLDLLDRAYNYCAKNGIHIIFIAGDLIDGNFGRSEKRISDVEKQISHLKKHYPFDKNILNFAVGGDHDVSALYGNGQDLIEVLKNYRHDIVCISYNNAFVNIKNDTILLHHHINTGKMFDANSNCPVMLIGHNHKYNILPQYNGNTLSIMVPSLSDINDSLPTAIELEFNFKNGVTTDLVATQIYFGDKDYILSRFNYSYNRIGNTSGPFYNVENYSFNSEIELKTNSETNDKKENLSVSPIETDTPVLVEEPIAAKKKVLSQVDKFNMKWGK